MITIIAVSDINVVQIAATLATLLSSPRLPLNNRQSRPTLGAVRGIRKVLEMTTRAAEVDVKARTTPLTKLRILLIDRSTT